MTRKEQLIQELDQMPESLLEEVFQFVLSLKVKHLSNDQNTSKADSITTQPESNSKAFLAYLESEEKWSEVYRRLASS